MLGAILDLRSCFYFFREGSKVVCVQVHYRTGIRHSFVLTTNYYFATNV